MRDNKLGSDPKYSKFASVVQIMWYKFGGAELILPEIFVVTSSAKC